MAQLCWKGSLRLHFPTCKVCPKTLRRPLASKVAGRLGSKRSWAKKRREPNNIMACKLAPRRQGSPISFPWVQQLINRSHGSLPPTGPENWWFLPKYWLWMAYDHDAALIFRGKNPKFCYLYVLILDNFVLVFKKYQINK